VLLGATRRMSVASAVVNVWSRSAWAAKAASNTLGSAFGDRFILGLGIGHRPLVEKMGLDYHGPLQAMRAYLDAMDAAPFAAAGPARAPMRVLAAMGPKMMALAAERCDGALPNCGTAEQTRDARTILGEKFLAPSLEVVLETDPTVARAVGRKALTPYWTLPNYLSHLRRSGWERG
jgi:probable F420-dependent oxidoreductase